MLPAVASTITPPGFSRPSRSAASIIVSAILSLIEPPGLALSSFRNRRHGPVSKAPVISIIGVWPISSRAEATGLGAGAMRAGAGMPRGLA